MLNATAIMNPPMVSVIMPVLNGELFISEAIKSALNQTFRDFEIIVVDGRSSDNTVSIVQTFILNDPRIRLTTQITSGLPAAKNLGIQTSKGKYIAFLESDDLWHPDKLLVQVTEMEKNPSIGLISCLSTAIDHRGKLLGWKLGVNENGNVYKAVLKRNPISSCSVPLIRSECLSEVGLFNNSCKFSDDWEMWIRFTKKFPIRTVPKVLLGYRRCYSNRSRNYKEMINDGEFILKEAFKNDPELPKHFYNFCLARKASTIAGMCLIDGQYKDAKECLADSFRRSRFAFLLDFRMFGIAALVMLGSILPVFVFENCILKWLLPLAFKIRKGKKFADLYASVPHYTNIKLLLVL